MDQQIIDNLIIELRRGTLILAVLSQLKKPQYGYSLLQKLEELEVPIEANTLYPLLRRLESQNLLQSSWSTDESRPRKYYLLSEDGQKILAALTEEWRHTSHNISRLLENK
ncbi:MAG: PadR family transcriptional regulator [Chloroflexi bacterium]|nr:PadR family transcriptional regulator [Chloroflexota bacterium]